MAASTPETHSPEILRVGISGCGWFGGVHVDRLSNVPNVHICALTDPNEEFAQRLAEKVPVHARPAEGVAIYTDYPAMLAHPGLDFVTIASPNKWHVEQILAALEAGLHVLCEKPLTMIPAEVTQVVEATQRSGKLVAVTYQSRYRRDARALQSALASGNYGRIKSVSIYSSEDWVTPNVGTWRHDPARCPGGFFADANGHQLDFMFWATGLRAKWVRATIENRGTPVPIVTWGESRLLPQETDAPKAGVQNPDGIPFTFTFVGDGHHWREEICITTEKADFVMRNAQLLWATGSKPLAPFPESERDPALADLPDVPDTAFVVALRGGPPIVTAPETVWPVLTFTLAGLASAANGSAPQTI